MKIETLNIISMCEKIIGHKMELDSVHGGLCIYVFYNGVTVTELWEPDQSMYIRNGVFPELDEFVFPGFTSVHIYNYWLKQQKFIEVYERYL